ncbi:MAG: hypothetical protein D6689_12465 [Deltaproteobacteria bacterium]|nr:MAG: hypothetical protein D6689_12465 [Deltaproteobacteria bacterium]
MANTPWWKTRRAAVTATFAAVAAAYAVTCAALDPRVEVDPPRVDAAMRAAADYLVRHAGADGRFVYEVDGAGAPVGGGRYNVLRHAGAIYSLAMYHELRPTPAVRDTLVRAARTLRARHVAPVAGLPGRSAVFSLPGEEAGGAREAKLGGAGLGLVALIAARALDPSVVDVDTLRQIGAFVEFMQRPDGSFRSKYSERDAFARDFDSLYYPGEAILGVAMLYEIDRDPRWLSLALRAARALIDRQRKMARLPNDHWLMIAIARLLPHVADAVDPPVTRDELVAHAIALGDAMRREQRWTRLVPGAAGAFTPDARVTPTTTRLEGLAAIALAVGSDHPARARFAEAIEDGIAFALACQVAAGPHRGGFRRALRRWFVGDDWQHVRVDYVQHALSALVGYAKIRGM